MVKNRSFSMLAVLMAVIMIVSLAFTPAARAEADDSALRGSADLNVVLGNKAFHVKAYADSDASSFALAGDVNLKGETADATVYISESSIVLQTSFLQDIFGIDLTKAAENLPGSAFAPGSGSKFALDQAAYAAALESLQMDSAKKEAAENEATEVLNRYWKLIQDAAADDLELSKKSETVTVEGEEVKTSAIEVNLNTDAIEAAVKAIMDEAATDEKVKSTAAALYTALSSAETLSDSQSNELLAALNRKYETVTGKKASQASGQDVMEVIWKEIPQMTARAVSFIREASANLRFHINTSKETKAPVLMDLGLSLYGDPLNIRFSMGENLSTSKEVALVVVASGEELAAARYTVSENTDSAYASVLTVNEGIAEDLKVLFDWNKSTGRFSSALTVNNETHTLTGTMIHDETHTVIKPETVDGANPGDITLTLTPGETIEAPAFTEILTLSSDQVHKAVTSISSGILILILFGR